MAELHYRLRLLMYGSPKSIIEALTDPRDIMKYTRAPAVSEPHAGGKYSVFEGSVSGEYTEVTDSVVAMKWRMRSWDDGANSSVRITLTPKGEGRTLLELIHTGIPSSDKFGHSAQDKMAESGWRERILGGIKAIIGIGFEEED